MKYFKRYLSLLLVAVFLLVAFSVPTSAASTKDLKFTMAVSDCDSSYHVIREVGYSGTVTPDPEKNTVRVGESFYGSDVKYAYARVKVFDSSNGVIMNSGNSYDFSFESVYYNNYLAVYKAPLVEFGLTFSDGTFVNLYEVPETSVSRGYFSSGSSASLWRINSKFKPEKDVTMITMRLYFDVAPIDPDYSEYVNYAIGYAFSGIELNEVTWLEGIISSIRNSLYSVFENVRNILDSLNILDFISNAITSLKDTVTSIPGKIVDIYNTVKEVPGKILDIPSNIWRNFKIFIVGLFLPESFPVPYSSDPAKDFVDFGYPLFWPNAEIWDLVGELINHSFHNSLREELGPIYALPDLFNEEMEDVLSILTNETNPDVITIQAITIPLPNNNSFTFGPYNVDVVPDGFEFLSDVSKFFTSSVLLFLLVFYMFSKLRRFLST